MYGTDVGSQTQQRPRRTPRTTTRRQVLDLIRTRAPISRVELAEITGLTPAAITHAVRSLLDEGLVEESGRRERTGGKPRVMLTISPRARCAVGVQLGADWIVVVITDATGAVIGRMRARGARQDEPADVVTAIAAHVDTLLRATGIGPDQLIGAGLAVPGTVDLEAGAIQQSRTLPRWGSHPVRDALSQALGVPVVMDADATAAAVGEHWSGRTAAASAHCTLYMGAGIGAGFVLAGAVHRGASGNPGPLGRLRFHRGLPAPAGERRDVPQRPGAPRPAADGPTEPEERPGPARAGGPETGREGPSLEDLAAPHAVAARARQALAHRIPVHRGPSRPVTNPDALAPEPVAPSRKPPSRKTSGREAPDPGSTTGNPLTAPAPTAGNDGPAPASAITLTDDGDPFRDFGAVASAAVHGDPLALALIEESAHYLADAVVTIADLLDIDSIALAGPSFSTAGSLYVSVLEQRLHTDLFAAGRHGVTVALAAHVADAAAVGAAALAFHDDPLTGPPSARTARRQLV